jgi:hypothetical protein
VGDVAGGAVGAMGANLGIAGGGYAEAGVMIGVPS